MRTTIDRGGRVVIPKAIRDELGLGPGDEVDITFDGWAIRIDRCGGHEPELRERDGILVIQAGAGLDDDTLRELRVELQS